MSTVKSKKLQVGTDATSSNNFTIYQPATPDGTLRIGVGNADSPTEVARVNSDGLADANGQKLSNTPIVYVYKASTQSLSEATNTTIQFDTKSIDTDNAFDTSTYKFTVPAGKAGKYQIQVDARLDGLASSNIDLAIAMIYKNNSIVKRNYWTFTANYIRTANPACSIIVDLAEGDTIQGVCYINTVSNVGGNLLGGVNQSSMYIFKLIG